jgi:tetratricopeptide (TPR) repeat protein
MDDKKLLLDAIYDLAHREYMRSGHEILIVELFDRYHYLAERPEEAYAWFVYGDSLRVIGRFEEAHKALLTALELSSDDEKGEIYSSMAYLYEKHKSPAEAEKWYDLAIAAIKEPPGWLQLLRGSNYFVLGRFEDAEMCFKRALETAEDGKDEAFLNLGLVYRATGDFKQAVEVIKKAIEINPENSEAKVALEGLYLLEEIDKPSQSD